MTESIDGKQVITTLYINKETKETAQKLARMLNTTLKDLLTENLLINMSARLDDKKLEDAMKKKIDGGTEK